MYMEVEPLAMQLLEGHLDDLSLESIGFLMSVVRQDVSRMRPVHRIITKALRTISTGEYVYFYCNF